MNNTGLYIHVPFCKSFCPYCDFYKVRVDKDKISKYVEALKKEIVKQKSSLGHKVVDTVYFGGGTPSVLPSDVFSEIVNLIRETYNVQEDAEITVECNPSSDLETLIPVLSKCGVNRISMGLQSAKKSERSALGRISGKSRVEECIKLIRANGIDNITLDLMIGIPNQTKDSLKESLEFIKQLNVPHVSAYMLKLEEGTNFYQRLQENKLSNLPDEDLTADMYMYMCEYFDSIGLKQYEISNFAQPGLESRHNLKYWRDEEYIGLGPAAHSYLNGKRFYTPNDLNAFVEGCAPIPDGVGGSYEERLMLALRLTEGFTGSLSEHTLNVAHSQALAPFLMLKPINKDSVMLEDVSADIYNICLTRSGFLVSNTIIGKLI